MISAINILIYSLFILSINYLSEPKKAYRGNLIAIFAMLLTFLVSLKNLSIKHLIPLFSIIILGAIIGGIIAKKIKMQNLPQLIAILNGLGGLSAGLLGFSEAYHSTNITILQIMIIIIGFITFSGSLASFFKLNNSIKINDIATIRIVNIIILILTIVSAFYTYNFEKNYLFSLPITCTFLGFLFILPTGGADSPIIISILNSLSGWSTMLVGFSFPNTTLIIVGTIIGISGIILSYTMTHVMHRSLLNVIFPKKNSQQENSYKNISNTHIGTIKDASFLLENANKVIIVPGYGMASASAQYELADMINILKNKYNADITLAIHPVAGRMPGHMNVLLAEANINPDIIFELKDINHEFQTTDVVYVIGANDIINPLAKTKTDSSIYRMPILEVEQAKRILIVKRSLSPGYAEIDNPLFYSEKTLMLFGDAKEITKQIISSLE